MTLNTYSAVSDHDTFPVSVQLGAEALVQQVEIQTQLG